MTAGPVGAQLERVVQHAADLGVARRREDGHVRDLRQQDEVEHAVVRGAVVSGDAGTIAHEHDRLVVEPHVEVHLVERP